MRWNDPEWRRDAEALITRRLEDLGRRLTAPVEYSHVRPWGTALRVPTNAGVVWFKQNIPELAFEVAIAETIAMRRPDCTPRVLASDRGRGWMLVEDAGVQLGDGVSLERWEDLLRRYAQLQLDLARDADALRAAGVPDRRAPRLLDDFERALGNERNLIDLRGHEVDRIRAAFPRLREAVAVVAEVGLPDTIQHDDLHEWNVYLSDGDYVFIDWGDACIAQPALSLMIPLATIERRFGGAAVGRARDAYYEPWTSRRSREELLAAHDAAVLLGEVTGILKWDLINSGLRDDERGEYAGSIPRRVRELLEELCG